jgi:polar amino acid transport system permease protein
MDFAIALRYLPDIASGLWQTTVLSVEVIIFGTLMGLAFIPLRISANPFIQWPTWIVVNSFRILPVLVLLVWGFYALPIGLGIRLTPWWVAVICLGLNMGAFCLEIFRKAVEEVPAEHVESAQLLGFSRISTLRKVILPLAFRNASIPFLNQILQTIKLTVLAAIISVPEIYHVTADIIQQTNKPLEMYTMLALVLFIPLLFITLAVEWIEKIISRSGRVNRWTWIVKTR